MLFKCYLKILSCYTYKTHSTSGILHVANKLKLKLLLAIIVIYVYTYTHIHIHVY